MLKIRGDLIKNLPVSVEVQFSLTQKHGNTITRIGNVIDDVLEVIIPNKFLNNDEKAYDYYIYAFIYLTDETSGNTKYEIIVPVTSRPKPEKPTEEPLPEPNIFHETVVAVNASAERAEKALGDVEEIRDNLNLDLSEKITRPQTAKVGQVLAVKEIDESGKPTVFEAEDVKVPTKTSELENDSGFLTEHQDISGKLDKEKLSEAIDDALAQAKESGEFDGKPGPKGDPGETTYIENPYDDSEIKKDVATKITSPKNPLVGKYLRVKSIDDNGLPILEWVDAPTGSDLDVRINGQSIVQDGVAEIPIIKGSSQGLVSVDYYATTGGLTKANEKTGLIRIFSARKTEIDSRSNYCLPIVSPLLDYAVKAVMCDGKGAAWTAEEQAMAKSRIGIDKLDRKLDALWKLNQGISYQFETDSTKAYQKDVPSGAKLVSVKKIGGRTIVWNQLVAKQAELEHNYGLDFAWLDNGKIEISGTSTYTDEDPNVYTILKSIEVIGNHKYLFKLTGTDRFCILGYGVGNATPTAQKLIFNASDSGIENITICGIKEKIQSGTVIDDIVCPQIFDLTKIFGAGNEPSTPEEFETIFPEDYYPYNVGEQMSAPIDEVAEHGKNYFDFSRLASDDVNVMDYEKQTITVPAKTNNTGYNQTLRDLCPGITPGTYVFSMKRSNPESGAGSYFLEAMKDFPIDTPIELTEALLDNHIAWYNNPDSSVENVISEIQIEKNSVKTSYSQYYQKSHKIPQAILNLDGYGESGIFVDFVEKKYHKLDRTIDISDILGDTFQEPFEVEAGGTLTFHNSNGDGYRLPVPNEEEYIVSLAEVGGGASE